MKSEQVLASYFTQLKEIINYNNLDAKQIVVAIPSFFTQAERINILNSAEIANMPNVKLIDQEVAMGLDFGMFKKK